MRLRFWTAGILVLALAAGGAAYFWLTKEGGRHAASQSALSFEQLTNTFFTPDPPDALGPPEVRFVKMPTIEGDAEVWGSTGRDQKGNIWIGVSVGGETNHSARLVEYDPSRDEAVDRGGVLENLERLGLMQPGEAQIKIHSRIVQASDGNLYFASMNDTHEEGGPRAPPFGSHLWRLHLPERRWEHVLAAPEGLVAVAGAGDFIYALGYPDHRLLQYHVPTGKSQWITVGSAGGHISRNFIVDARGHAFVPRLRSAQDITLVEFDTDLRELAATPLQHYLNGSPDAAHGIVSFQHMPDRSVYFTTDIGRLYRIDTDFGSGPGLVTDAGWFSPKGSTYTPSMFTYSGTNTLVGLGYRKNDYSGRADWLTYDLKLRLPSAVRFIQPIVNGKPLKGELFYGSQTRDRYGDFYVVGAYTDGRPRPMVLRVKAGHAPAGKPEP